MLALLFFSFQLTAQVEQINDQGHSGASLLESITEKLPSAKKTNAVRRDKAIAPSSCPVTICINTGGNPLEKPQLVTTLTDLGFTVLEVTSVIGQTCTVAINQPGNHGISNSSWVSAGNGYVQVSDWGPDFISNAWNAL